MRFRGDPLVHERDYWSHVHVGWTLCERRYDDESKYLHHQFTLVPKCATCLRCVARGGA